ncbi:hypothetical protein FGO68_gene8955 [Halteria grandinella]|uniref:Uncharacterized protein n=1 Tax=Halteria grandinella TaxID=5974 RepID=A0A8J8NAA8_HALGN|nr:hypothetical protein FGO68_gene8955 [Halteria grandinella]
MERVEISDILPVFMRLLLPIQGSRAPTPSENLPYLISSSGLRAAKYQGTYALPFRPTAAITWKLEKLSILGPCGNDQGKNYGVLSGFTYSFRARVALLNQAQVVWNFASISLRLPSQFIATSKLGAEELFQIESSKRDI